MTATYTNRKGKTYYLHQGKTKLGNPKYVFALRDEGNLVEAIPPGYEVYENPNGQVFLRRTKTQIITDEEAAVVEAGMRQFLEDGNFKAFTTTFEDLHGLVQLPGLAVQRLMADGFGFGAEGDWKTAALVRAMKVMSTGLDGGTSFMEDYTYHLEPGNNKVLGAHMLEICSSIAEGTPTLEMHPLGIGGKADPARLVFNVPAGPG